MSIMYNKYRVFKKNNTQVSEEEILILRDTIEAKDKELRERNQLLGRFIFEYIGNQTAYYEITRISNMSVRIRAATTLIVPRWGKETILPMSYALRNIEARDNIIKTLERKISV